MKPRPQRSSCWIQRREYRSVRDDIDAVGAIKEHQRFYPNSTVGAQVIGFTGLDPKGLAGLEAAYDKTLLLLLGQERETISIVVDGDTVAAAAPFDSGVDFLALLGLSGGMPTRVSVPRARLDDLFRALQVPRP